jgi:hypothetical protein
VNRTRRAEGCSILDRDILDELDAARLTPPDVLGEVRAALVLQLSKHGPHTYEARNIRRELRRLDRRYRPGEAA